MAELHIVRDHALGLAKARKIAFKWAEQAESEFGMACSYEEGKTREQNSYDMFHKSIDYLKAIL